MVRERTGRESEFSHREFLVTTSGALAGVAAFGLANPAGAGKRHPQRGGTLLYSARSDAAGLDAHTHNQLHISALTTAMYTGLTDLDAKGNIVPGIAESWEPNKELTSWVFRLRKGMLFHNGREVDAEAVKLNLTRLMAPDAFDKAAEHPIGTGPFKFISWIRYNETQLVRFENYWETDAEGHQLPYLDEIIGKPKREDSVRLTALRTGQVQLINSMANADVKRFKESDSGEYNTWTWHQGGRFLVFNFRGGPFQDKHLRTAAGHAIDRRASHHVVYYENGAMNNQPYPEWSPWHLEGIHMLEYDPDRAKALLRKARAVGTELKLVCSANLTQSRESAQVIQDQWRTVGFKVTVEPLDTVPFRQARAEGAFDGLINGHTYRYDPDDFYGRNLHSKSEYAQILSGWQNERFDRLIEEAKRTLAPERRKELYTEAWNILNVELPHFYLHAEVYTSAATKDLRGYQPNMLGALHYHGGGFRTAYIAA
jgi:peptide/nickel transport system substrate-binding protein